MVTKFYNTTVFSVGSIVTVDSFFNPFNNRTGIVSCVNEVSYGKETDIQILNYDTEKIEIITVQASQLVDGDESHSDIQVIKDLIEKDGSSMNLDGDSDSVSATVQLLEPDRSCDWDSEPTELDAVPSASCPLPSTFLVEPEVRTEEEEPELLGNIPLNEGEIVDEVFGDGKDDSVDAEPAYLTESEELECSSIIDSIISHNQSIDEFLWKLKYQIFGNGVKKSQRFATFDEVCRYLHKEHKLPAPATCYERAWAFEERRILTHELKVEAESVKMSVNTLLELRKEPDLEKKQELFETALHHFGANGSITARNIQEAKQMIDNDFDDTPPPPPGTPKPKLKKPETITLQKAELEKMIEDAIASSLLEKETEFKESMIAYQIEVRESALAQAQEEIRVREQIAHERGKQEVLSQYEQALREIEILRQKLAIASRMEDVILPTPSLR